MSRKDNSDRGGVTALRDRMSSTDRKGMAILAVAFVLAAGCGAGMYWYLKNVPTVQAAEAPKTESVVVATQDMTFGTKLEETHLKVVQYPKESLPTGYYSSVDSVLAQSTKVFLMEGEPVLASKLSAVGGGLSLRIPDEMRAISLSVNEITGVNGFILPGDRIDVLVTIDNAKGSNIAVTKTILQNIEVLASGSKTETRRNHQITVQTVTLLVNQEGAENLSLGMHQGEVNLVLRNPVDQVIVQTKPTDTKKVLDLYSSTSSSRTRSSSTKPAPAPEPPTYTIIRNGSITQQESPEKK
jgi:pilus assembly protein CpaB